MKVLLIGGGGREHALARGLAQSPRLSTLYASPGNPGIAHYAQIVSVGDAAVFCRQNAIDLVVIGPEQPLVEGLADQLRDAGVAVFGPSAAAARLEGSKGFTKALCARLALPTAKFEHHRDGARALAACERLGWPAVVKADGLAAGKGVTIANDRAEAGAALDAIFAEPDGEVVIEQFLEGEEVSLFVLSDGRTARVLGSAQDHKRVGDGDTGLNTGGMGAYSPATVLTPELEAAAMTRIVEPTLAAMRDAGTPFVGVLYAGLMLTTEGPQLIEYNVRFGDPEAQVVLPRLDGDLLGLLHATATGALGEVQVKSKPEVALTVVVAAEGYPGEPRKGGAIEGVDEAERDGATVYQAGTQLDGGHLVASGGRVLAVTATGADIVAARNRAYAAVDRINFADGFHRRDIGWREIARAGGAD